MSTITSPILRLPYESQSQIFNFSICNKISQIRVLPAVCQTWNLILQKEAHSCLIWEPIFDFHVKNLTFCMDLSLATNCKEKVKLFIETRKRDLENIQKSLDECSLSVNVQCFLDRKNDSTPLLKLLIKHQKFESVALALLYIQFFDPNQIALALHESIVNEVLESKFCLQILFKLGHNLREYIEKVHPLNVTKLMACNAALIPQFNGVRVEDLLKSGYKFSSIVNEDENLQGDSFFSILLMTIFTCYKGGKFSPGPLQFTPTPLISKRLEKFKRQDPPSECEIRQFLMDLILTCNLDLNRKMTPMPIFLSEGGTLLTFIKSMATHPGMPQSNLFSDLLKEMSSLTERNPLL